VSVLDQAITSALVALTANQAKACFAILVVLYRNYEKN
jgi:hypothetical protein